MSHFSVMVISTKYPSEGVLREIMQPYHEFECTGVVDEYVLSIDKLEEYRGYFSDYEGEDSFEKFLQDEYGYKRVDGEPDLEGENQFGWYKVGEGGEVIEVIDRTNPNKKWDWWMVGGRFSGFLEAKDRKVGVKGERGLMGSEYDRKGVDILRKGDVDFEGMRLKRYNRAVELWDLMRGVIGDKLEGFRTWESLVAEYSVEKAREIYHGQEAVKAKGGVRDLWFYKVDDFLISREEYGEKSAKENLSTFAILWKGEWIEKGRASVSEERGDWVEEYNRILGLVGEEEWLCVVDCHI